MKNWLNKPFPIIQSKKEKILISLYFALFVFVFLFFFKPFNIPEASLKYFFIYFLITFSVKFLNLLLLPFFFKKAFEPNNWKIKKYLYISLWIMIIIAIFNWLYYISEINVPEEYINNYKYSFIEFIFFTILVGVFPVTFYVMYIEISSKKINKKNNKIQNKKQKYISIISRNQKENMILELEKFICIRSESNYLYIFYIENEHLKKKLIRNSLVEMEKNFIDFDFVKEMQEIIIYKLIIWILIFLFLEISQKNLLKI